MNLKKWQIFQYSCELNRSVEGSKFGLCSKTSSNCEYNKCPFKENQDTLVSCGTQNKEYRGVLVRGVNALTVQETRALSLRNKRNLSYSKIADDMDITKPRAWKLVQNALKKIGDIQNKEVNSSKKTKKQGVNDKLRGLTVVEKKGLTKSRHNVELHKDSIGISCKADLDKTKGKLVSLKYADYRFIKNEDVVLKIFENKLVVQFRKPIERINADECHKYASMRIDDFINDFSMNGVFIDKIPKQLERHYAIIGTEIAKKYVKEGEKLFIYDPKTGKLALMVDYSDKDKKGGMPHLETPHVEKGREYINSNQKHIEDVTFKEHYLPSEAKELIDRLIRSQELMVGTQNNSINIEKDYAYNIKLHLEVQKETLKTLKAIQESVKK